MDAQIARERAEDQAAEWFRNLPFGQSDPLLVSPPRMQTAAEGEEFKFFLYPGMVQVERVSEFGRMNFSSLRLCINAAYDSLLVASRRTGEDRRLL